MDQNDDLNEDGYASGEEILEVRGKVLLRARTYARQPLVFFTEDAAVDASEAFLEVLLARQDEGRIRSGQEAVLGFLDIALPADGVEMAYLVHPSRLIEPWMVAQLIGGHWGMTNPPLLLDLPNWFCFREGFVSVTWSKQKWRIDIRHAERTDFLEGSRIFIAF